MTYPCTQENNIANIDRNVQEMHSDVKILLAYHNQKIGEERILKEQAIRKSIKRKSMIKIVVKGITALLVAAIAAIVKAKQEG